MQSLREKTLEFFSTMLPTPSLFFIGPEVITVYISLSGFIEWCGCYRSSGALSAVCMDGVRRTAELGDRCGTYPKSRPPSSMQTHGRHIIRPHRMQSTRTRSVVIGVAWALCLCVCWTQLWALQIRLNQLKCRLRYGLGTQMGPGNNVLGGSSVERDSFGTFPAHYKL